MSTNRSRPGGEVPKRELTPTWRARRLMLTVLGSLVELGRDLTRVHTGEGREPAKWRGVKFGLRP
jgi:hypothetical protein